MGSPSATCSAEKMAEGSKAEAHSQHRSSDGVDVQPESAPTIGEEQILVERLREAEPSDNDDIEPDITITAEGGDDTVSVDEATNLGADASLPQKLILGPPEFMRKMDMFRNQGRSRLGMSRLKKEADGPGEDEQAASTERSATCRAHVETRAKFV